MVDPGVDHLTPSDGASALKKGGGAPSTITPPVRRADAPGEAGTRGAQPRFALSQRTRKMLVVPRLVRRFGEVPKHNGESSAL